ncbi:MAG: HAMP domain-containing protein [Lachnospiraceae bacterium]|nr:HAMP domain-containing protein [Lachnospiraceae bacterium]
MKNPEENSEAKTRRGLSFRAKSTLIFVGLFALLIAALWLINSIYLQKYYLRQQLARLEDTRRQVEELAKDPDNEDLELQLTLQCESSGIAAVLAQESRQGYYLIVFTAGGERGPWQMWGRENEPNRPQTVFKKTEHYVITQAADPVTRSDKIECTGTVTADSGEYLYLLSLPMARIEESAEISNRFLLMIGAGILALGAVLVFLFTRRMTEPILVLDRLSQKMADLDFSERFEGRSGDEIQTLGENINHLSDRLETTISDLTQANLTLEEDVREKEEENRRRTELLANISHELKTPIALIQGYAEGLRDGMCEDEDTRTRYSDIILDEANRMNRLVRQLLSLNEMESGGMRVDKTDLDLSVLIREMTAPYQVKAAESGARLEVDVPERLPVVSDELLLEQILQNYLSNAFHYVKDGGLVRVSAEPQEGGALISVYNEGEPIPEEALEQVWNKFYKVDKARTRTYGGSGIGLSVVKAAAELLGGSCGVENLDGGVCFTARI